MKPKPKPKTKDVQKVKEMSDLEIKKKLFPGLALPNEQRVAEVTSVSCTENNQLVIFDMKNISRGCVEKTCAQRAFFLTPYDTYE